MHQSKLQAIINKLLKIFNFYLFIRVEDGKLPRNLLSLCEILIHDDILQNNKDSEKTANFLHSGNLEA